MSVSSPTQHPDLLIPREDEVVCFLHIPKTAGITFNLYLERQFCHQPGAIAHFPEFEFDAHLRGLDEAALRPVRYLRTHWDQTVAGLLSKRVLFLTFLREPVARLVSLYRFCRALPPEASSQASLIREREMDFARFALGAELAADCDNRMARQIAGDIQGAIPSYVPLPGERVRWMHPAHPPLAGKALLQQALRHLDRFAFVGLTERFDESLELLEATFGWPHLHDVLTQNTAAAAGHPDIDPVSPELRRAILERNWVDVRLREHMEAEFDTRLQRLREDRRAGRPFSLALASSPRFTPAEKPPGAVLVDG